MESWIKDMLFLKKAEENINLVEIDKKVDSYRKSLILSEYKKLLSGQKVSIEIDEADWINAYKKYNREFIIEEPMASFQFAVFSFQNENTKNFVNQLNKDYDNTIGNAIAYCNEKAESFSLDSKTWITVGEFSEKYNVNIRGTTNKFISYSKNDTLVVYKVDSFLDESSIAPIEYIRPKLKEIIIFERKQELVSNLIEKNYQNEKNTNAYEIY